jgi:hypothetical protein
MNPACPDARLWPIGSLHCRKRDYQSIDPGCSQKRYLVSFSSLRIKTRAGQPAKKFACCFLPILMMSICFREELFMVATMTIHYFCSNWLLSIGGPVGLISAKINPTSPGKRVEH